MPIRPFRPDDAPGLAELAASCSRGESDFVLNPLWETPEELFAEFERFGIEPAEHLLVADSGDGEVLGMAGFLRRPDDDAAGLFCPIVRRSQRGKGLGGKLLRAALELGKEELGIQLATAGIGTRNRAGYSLLTALGFRPMRQFYVMRCDASPDTPDASEDVKLERATPNDAADILHLYTVCGFEERDPAAMERVMSDGRHAHLVARHDDRLVGFVEIETHWRTRVWVAYVGVAQDRRQRGLGSRLVARALQEQFAEHATEALLMLSPANRSALRAYEKVGLKRHRLIDVLEKAL